MAVTVVMLVSRLGCDFGEGFLSSSVSQQGRKECAREGGQSGGRGGASPYCPRREEADKGCDVQKRSPNALELMAR